MLKNVLIGVVLVGVVGVGGLVLYSLPDLVRYLKISRM